ncbi:hypothetical protein LINPERHAP1_LOCUS21572 [Linum perenne]
MEFIPTEERRKNQIEDCKRMLVSCAGLSWRKDEEEQLGFRSLDFEDDGVDKIVCVTSGVSFLGVAIVNRLLVRGYLVRILVDNQAARIGDRRKFDDDRDVNLVRFGSGSGIAKDDHGWLLDLVSLALKHGLKDFNNNQGFHTLKLKVGKNLKVIQAHRTMVGRQVGPLPLVMMFLSLIGNPSTRQCMKVI